VPRTFLQPKKKNGNNPKRVSENYRGASTHFFCTGQADCLGSFMYSPGAVSAQASIWTRKGRSSFCVCATRTRIPGCPRLSKTRRTPPRRMIGESPCLRPYTSVPSSWRFRRSHHDSLRGLGSARGGAGTTLSSTSLMASLTHSPSPGRSL
jgi:hypothetical protein